MITIPAPMLAPERLHQPFTSPDWLYEIKFDGYRVLAGIEKDDGAEHAADAAALVSRIQMQTRSGASCITWFGEIAQALAKLPGGPHVVDGEACVLREDGTSDFNALQERARRRRWWPGAPRVSFCAFDLLVADGGRVMDRPLIERKAMLRELLADADRTTILYVQDLPADAQVFGAMVDAGLQIEGVMAKRRDSTYQPGVRSLDWRKIKRPGWQDGRHWRP